jgi:tetratricopeptide (TPR) repeat protein
MFARRSATVLIVLVLTASIQLVASEGDGTQRLERNFQVALAHYNSGQYPAAAQELESLAVEVPENFEVQELLGLAYSAQSLDAKAHPHLQRAVRLKPDSAAARTNLAVNLLHLGKTELAEAEFKNAIKIEPGNFDAAHDLGELYVRDRKIAQAIPLLEQAQRIDPSSYDNGYDLSLAYETTGRLADARQLITGLLRQKDTAELHNLLGSVEEKDGQFVEAANQYQLAAHMQPSESNLFDWGCELLLHRTLAPAIEVFEQGTARYPDSPRLTIGLGIAHYSRGDYDEAVKALLRAIDLQPSDPRAYYFLSKAYDSSPSQADEVIQHFHRLTELQPRNGQAFYYYAMSLWKGKRAEDPSLDLHQIESLLSRAIALDPTLAEAHFQLGNVYSDQKQYAESIPEYEEALKLNAELEDAHYRLGQAYVHAGKKDLAQAQFQVYQRMRAQHLADLDKQRDAIRQFVISTKDSPVAKH